MKNLTLKTECSNQLKILAVEIMNVKRNFFHSNLYYLLFNYGLKVICD